MRELDPAKMLFKIPEVMATTGYSRGALYAQIRSGALPIVKLGRSTRIHRADLEAWIEALREESR